MLSSNSKWNKPYLTQKDCLIFKISNLKEIWLFNCPEGCQQYFIKQKIKIIQISTIIITNLNIESVCGLPGLLSSLSLLNRKNGLHIYAPKGLENYLHLKQQYSHTHFRYHVYFHRLNTRSIIKSNYYEMYSFYNNLKFEFVMIAHRKYGKFKLNKATMFGLIIGPLYGELKKNSQFILPDGLTLDGQIFTKIRSRNSNIIFTIYKYINRPSIEIISI
uniref:Uncharacterized protein n=1 Tax=Schizymenia dubyi TaxID=38368 RepID=A0A1C9C9E5_9FLOR|nr:hypothetical protein Schiz_124 [Schizymenia dubyi]AOM65007.1 hypothetical protein Schiz_124 [Schizymenia dubyi]